MTTCDFFFFNSRCMNSQWRKKTIIVTADYCCSLNTCRVNRRQRAIVIGMQQELAQHERRRHRVTPVLSHGRWSGVPLCRLRFALFFYEGRQSTEEARILWSRWTTLVLNFGRSVPAHAVTRRPSLCGRRSAFSLNATVHLWQNHQF